MSCRASSNKRVVWEDFASWEGHDDACETMKNACERNQAYGGDEESEAAAAITLQRLDLPPIAHLPSCKVIIRSRHACSTWEKFVKTVVGDPVHMDVVLVKEGSAGARFCFSSYMNQKFEMIMMDRGLVYDKNVSNMTLDITEDEHERCTRFMMTLVEKASYDYFDAMVLMPMAPKVTH